MTHAEQTPRGPPNRGRVQLASSAYAETLVLPRIIGPTAPMGTAAPWASQTETMEVKNMAGKTDAIPASRGLPREASQTLKAIATPASRPRASNAKRLTFEDPFGAGEVFQQLAMPPTIWTIKQRMPSKATGINSA